jgi:hypothetical protein
MEIVEYLEHSCQWEAAAPFQGYIFILSRFPDPRGKKNLLTLGPCALASLAC